MENLSERDAGKCRLAVHFGRRGGHGNFRGKSEQKALKSHLYLYGVDLSDSMNLRLGVTIL